MLAGEDLIQYPLSHYREGVLITTPLFGAWEAHLAPILSLPWPELQERLKDEPWLTALLYLRCWFSLNDSDEFPPYEAAYLPEEVETDEQSPEFELVEKLRPSTNIQYVWALAAYNDLHEEELLASYLSQASEHDLFNDEAKVEALSYLQEVSTLTEEKATACILSVARA